MKAFKVQYRVKESYVSTNIENIKKVMADLREINDSGIKYSTYQGEDGQEFVHLALFADEDANKVLADLPSFQSFQKQLKESGPESPPKADPLNLVASGYEIF